MAALVVILVFVLMALFFIFVFAIAFGAPYVPTLSAQRKNALDLLDLKDGQTLLELGSGDGRVLFEAADRGWKAIGYEVNPVLVLLTRWKARKYGGKVKVVWSSFWRADFAEADGIFVFQMDRSMKHLEDKIRKEGAGKKIKVASNAFTIPGQKPAEKRGAVMLYVFDGRQA